MVTAATRRDARERAIELLYEAETKGVDIEEILVGLPLRPDDYALELATGVIDHQIELDVVLGRHARSWAVERMAVIDRIVLRLGTFELATKLDVPTGAVLSEAVELGGQYGSTDETSRFVNGVLVAVGDEVRKTRPWQPIEAVVFDMDGVFRHWLSDHLSDAEDRLALDPGSIAREAFAQPQFDQAMRGELSVEEWAAGIGERVATDDADLASTVAQVWLESSWRLDDQMVDLARRVKSGGTTTAVLSNASTNLESDMTEMQLDDVFDVVANSSRLGVCKPEPEIYAQVTRLVGVEPERILFVDDREPNVVAAVEAGWHAVVMRSVDRFDGVLRRLGIDGAAAAS